MDHREYMTPEFITCVDKGKHCFIRWYQGRSYAVPYWLLTPYLIYIHATHTALGLLLEHLPEQVRIPQNEAVRLACIININSHGTNAPASYNDIMGIGLYPLLAMLNHSCRPNCFFFFDDGAMKVIMIIIITRI